MEISTLESILAIIIVLWLKFAPIAAPGYRRA